MKLIASFTIVALLSLSSLSQESGDKFVYADFEKLDFDAETTELILKGNAARLLGLTPTAGASAAPA